MRLRPPKDHAIVAIVTGEEQVRASGLVMPGISPGDATPILNNDGTPSLDDNGKPRFNVAPIQSLEFAPVYGLVLFSEIDGLPNAKYNGDMACPKDAEIVLLPHMIDGRPDKLFTPIKGDPTCMKTGDVYCASSEKIVAVFDKHTQGWKPFGTRLMVKPDPLPQTAGDTGIYLSDVQNVQSTWSGTVLSVGSKATEVSIGDHVWYALREKMKDKAGSDTGATVSTVSECFGANGKIIVVKEEHVLMKSA